MPSAHTTSRVPQPHADSKYRIRSQSSRSSNFQLGEDCKITVPKKSHEIHDNMEKLQILPDRSEEKMEAIKQGQPEILQLKNTG